MQQSWDQCNSYGPNKQYGNPKFIATVQVRNAPIDSLQQSWVQSNSPGFKCHIHWFNATVMGPCYNTKISATVQRP
jgi:hypothetical protein